MNKYIRLIGGPLDGTVAVIDEDRDFHKVAVYPPVPLFPSADPVGPVEYKVVTYIPRKVAGIELWAPEIMNAHNIVQLLVMRYFNGNAR
jgi:hypothetical protein